VLGDVLFLNPARRLVPNHARHDWVIAPFRADRDVAPRRVAGKCHDINAHRNLRGSYTGAIEIVRRLLNDRVAPLPKHLIDRHQLSLLLVCPELATLEFASAESLQWRTFSMEGNSPSRTARLGHGLTDFLLECAEQGPARPLCLSFENVDLADRLDQEFLSVLLRRSDPHRLTMRVCTSSDRLDEPLRSALRTFASENRLIPFMPASTAAIPETWRIWLSRCATGWAGEWDTLSDLSKYLDLLAIRPEFSNLRELCEHVAMNIPLTERRTLGNEYVSSDCTSDNLVAKSAYLALSAAERSALHRARRTELDALNQASLSLGAIPLHAEQEGVDPASLLAASKHYMRVAFYDAALDWALRGRRMLPAADRGQSYTEFSRNILFALLLLGRLDEVDVICAEYLTTSNDPLLLAHTSYAKAILTARLYEPSRRDYDAARGWIEKSLSFTEMVAPSETRAVNIAFLRNTMALVEMREGRLEAAHELLCEGLRYMCAEAPNKYDAESAILLHNRARLHIKREQLPEAIEDLTTLLQHQPCNSDAYFDRAILSQWLGLHERALRDYEAAIEWSPPYAEAYFNRARTLVSLGRVEEAILGYTRVLDLVPDHIEALIDRACLFHAQKKFEASRTDVNSALPLAPASARLLCLQGLLEMENANLAQAYEIFTKAIDADPSLPDAWANRATVLFKQGEPGRACVDLTHALSLREDAAAFYNRGRCFESQKRWTDAAADYHRALGLMSGDARHVLRHLALCEQAEDKTDL
jgi:tetratricopeptide (TPR) repeat protein